LANVYFKGKKCEALESESVLQVLNRHNIPVPYSCQSGICQTCILRCLNGDLPGESQKGIKDTLKAQGYFLSCVCKPSQDIEVDYPKVSEIYGRAVVREKSPLSETITRVILEPATPLYYHAGQFINIRRHDGLIRSYSIASLPQEDKCIELHIKIMNGGDMSNWIADDMKVGDEIDIQGPNGSCFYLSGQPDQNLLLLSTGSGLAPLIGIIRDAINSKHEGTIYLYHGGATMNDMYLHDYLEELKNLHSNFKYIPVLDSEDNQNGFEKGYVSDIAFEHHKDLKGWRSYICGNPNMVNSARKKAYLAGADLNNIYIDPFELTELRQFNRS
jgi:NAD(P)H-flavin reductase/ferredoxin